MSNCKNGGRDVFAMPPIRGSIHYADGTESQFTYSRLVNGDERVVVAVEVDGVIYLPEGEVA